MVKFLKLQHGVKVMVKHLGCVIEGVPPNLSLNERYIQKDLDKRKPGQSKFTTQRKEDDKVKILSGVFNGKTTGNTNFFVNL